MGLLDALARKPRWAAELPSDLRPPRDQVAALEAVRRREGLDHSDLFHYVAGHPSTTRRVHMQTYKRLKADPEAQEELAVRIRLVMARLKAAMANGEDLFDLASMVDGYERDAFFEKVEQIVQEAGSLDGLIQAMIDDEAGRHPARRPARGFEQVQAQLDSILTRR